MSEPDLHPDTVAVHAGREGLAELGVHALPIDLSSTNPLPDIERGGDSYEALTGGRRPPEDGSNVYGRLWNPTVARFEQALAALEGGDEAVAFASGMAAVTAAVLALCAATGKRHVVGVRPLYGGTDSLLAGELLGIEHTFCGVDAVGRAIRPDTGLVIMETPANPTLDLVDIAAVVAQAGEVPVLVDNTFATPVLQNPLAHGARLSLHSATKYIGGHGDVIAGAIACDAETAIALRRVRTATGSVLHPLAGYLLHRGLTTLPVRMRAQQENARAVAAFLRRHPAVSHVYYPDEDTTGVLGTQLRGPGAMVSIALRGGYDAAERFTSRLRIFTHAVSLGGVDSLVQHPAAISHRHVAPDARPGADIVRLSIGLEDAGDLVADLEHALA